MEVSAWFAQHWFELLQTVSIVGGLFFTGYSILKEAEARRVGNILTINQHHREIWKQLYERPQLFRVLKPDADLTVTPVSDDEVLLVRTLILHLDSVHRAMNAGMFVKIEGLKRDIREFFSLPVPASVWQKVRPLQNADFVAFLEACLKEDGR